jgi:hypothetical protein
MGNSSFSDELDHGRLKEHENKVAVNGFFDDPWPGGPPAMKADTRMLA